MPSAKTRPVGNLPALLSSFIGRTREIGEVKASISAHRLVTLTGAGGCGKTRLAYKAADEMTGEFEYGVWVVELAPLADPALVLQSIASAFGIHEKSGRSLNSLLIEHLKHKRVLLLVDNCEHLISQCAVILEELLQACPDLKVLATSREMLGIPGEFVYTVPPLSMPEIQPWKNPESAKEAIQTYQRSEAVRLFVARAASAVPEFAMTTENGGRIAEICRRLDGMPLAIELAAARVRSLSVAQIAERLDDRFHLLTAGSRTGPLRQQTLAAALDWSYSLLSTKEQKVFQRLSVFAGGATIEAAEAVCADEEVEAAEVLDVLSLLVNKSLVTANGSERDETRYSQLETIRQYAHDKLEESGGMNETKNRLLDYFVNWAERAEPYLNGGERIVTRNLKYLIQSAAKAEPQFNEVEQLFWLKQFEIEHDNLRASLEWSLIAANRAEVGLRLAVITAVFWKMHGHHNEGRTWLTNTLAHEGAQSPTLVRALALLRNSLLAFYQSDYPVVRTLAEESLVISREQGLEGRLAVADALEILAEAASETGDYSKATKLYEEALPLYREVGDLSGIGDTLKMLGWGALRTGDYEKAESLLNEGLIVCREANDSHQIISALSGLGELALRQGQYTRAESLFEESLTLNKLVGEKWGFAIVLGNMGWVALRKRDFREMRRLLRQSLHVRLETGDRGGIAWCLEKLAEANCLQSRFEQALIIFGAAAALREPVGSVIDAVDRPDYKQMISNLRTSLGDEAFETAWAKGQTMILEQAINLALAEPEPGEIDVLLKEKYGGLTEREREVAALIAEGKSNREIANTMTVGVKTIETYVTRILNKLGLNSRVQIATWSIETGLYKKESK
jgi:non-specific serine/threonine protein kinase